MKEEKAELRRKMRRMRGSLTPEDLALAAEHVVHQPARADLDVPDLAEQLAGDQRGRGKWGMRRWEMARLRSIGGAPSSGG